MAKPPKRNLYDVASKVGDDAPLRSNTSKPTEGYKAKSLRAVPVSFFEAHEKLRTEGKTTLDMSSYIVEALREKLTADGALD